MTTFTTRPEIRGSFGVTTSTHWIASTVGMGILERGGNAFDAAVATAMVLQIVEPHLNGPAGDMPAIFHSAKTGMTEVLCAQGVARALRFVARTQIERGVVPAQRLTDVAAVVRDVVL